MRTIVTGGAGFIGSHLCEKLLKQGHDVICIDNLGSGSLENIMHLIKYINQIILLLLISFTGYITGLFVNEFIISDFFFLQC